MSTIEDARLLRNEAMGRVEAHAPEIWKDQAWDWLVSYLKQHAEFFPDDVWDAGLTAPPEKRAFGPLVARASRAGYIKRTSKTRQRTLGHATTAVVWESTIFGCS